MSIAGLDHVAIPIRNVDVMLAFYQALGFELRGKPPLYSMHFGHNKINMHCPSIWESGEFTLRGPTAEPGCGDFCFVWDGDAESLASTLRQTRAEVEEGPVGRRGGRNDDWGTSTYIRDPDGNLLEFIIY